MNLGAVNPGSTWGQLGVKSGCTWGQTGVSLGSTRSQPGVNQHRPTMIRAVHLLVTWSKPEGLMDSARHVIIMAFNSRTEGSKCV